MELSGAHIGKFTDKNFQQSLAFFTMPGSCVMVAGYLSLLPYTAAKQTVRISYILYRQSALT
jgi:hypothetical protein